jgi:hypothetical protein
MYTYCFPDQQEMHGSDACATQVQSEPLNHEDRRQINERCKVIILKDTTYPGAGCMVNTKITHLRIPAKEVAFLLIYHQFL